MNDTMGLKHKRPLTYDYNHLFEHIERQDFFSFLFHLLHQKNELEYQEELEPNSL